MEVEREILKRDIIDQLIEEEITLDELEIEWRNDREVVLAALEVDPDMLMFASLELRNDKEIVRASMMGYSNTILHASSILKKDTYFIMSLLMDDECTNKSKLMKYIPEVLRNDKHFMIPILQIDGRALKYVSPRLRGNKNVVSAAIESEPGSLLYASKKIRHDAMFIVKAMEHDPSVLEHASKNIKDNKEIILKAIKISWTTWFYCSERLKKDALIYMEALKQCYYPFVNGPEEFRNRKKYIRAFLKHDKDYTHVNLESFIRENRKLFLYDLKKRNEMMKYASPSLKMDRQLHIMSKIREYHEDFVS